MSKIKIGADEGQRVVDFQKTVSHWGQNRASFTPTAWQHFIELQGLIPFLPATLGIDRDLWGDFWQGDVIAPGYVLPALELAYLRAARLAKSFPDSTPHSYLQTLQRALAQFPSGAWLAQFGSSLVLCVAFKQKACGEAGALALIIWLVDGLIAAGYKEIFVDTPGYNLHPLRPPVAATPALPPQNVKTQPLLERLSEWQAEWPNLNRAARIDTLIQVHRAYSHVSGTPAAEKISRWLAEHAL